MVSSLSSRLRPAPPRLGAMVGPLLVPLLALLLALVSACSSETAADVVVPCKVDADCAGLDDGDLCNGSQRCDVTSGVCAVDPTTAVVCDPGNDTPCRINRCAAATGACALVALPSGTPCEDGEPCTLGDRCQDASCKPGDDVCACQADADCKDDGDLCNGTPICNTGAFPHRCEISAKTIVTCAASDDACKQNVCAPKTGTCALQPRADGTPCDDGDACTAKDGCADGSCKPGTDTCACTKDSDCKDLDGDLCTGVPYCAQVDGKGVCKDNPATVVTCSDAADTACRKNVCNPKDGSCALQAVQEQKPCDDGDSCTTGEVCKLGLCAGGKDTCKCTADTDCKGQDDGNLCNGTPFCDLASGKCVTNPATVISCPTVDDTACSFNVCLPEQGTCTVLPRAEVKLQGCYAVELGGGVVVKSCTYVAKQVGEAGDPGPFLCDDGNPCTQGDACKGTGCAPGPATCECTTDADCAGKDDGDLCNGVQFCDASGAVPSCKPQPASEVFCTKANDTECLKNTCAPKLGTCALAPAATGTACEDGDLCSATSGCDGKGDCVAGKATDCDDKDACTIDACAKDKGCSHVAKNCADGNDCTPDVCDSALGTCKSAVEPAGKACNADSDGCTVGDACDGKGSCKAGSPAICAASLGICQVNACQSKGVDGFSCAVVTAKDGTACDDGDSCTASTACKAGACTAAGSSLYAQSPDVGGAMAFDVGRFLTGKLPPGANGVAEGGTGGLALAGRLLSGSAKDQWQVRLLDAGGALRSTTQIAAPAGISALGPLVALLDRGALGVVLVGRATRSDKSLATVAALVGLDGKLQKTLDLTASPSNDRARVMRTDVATLHPTGAVVLAGWVDGIGPFPDSAFIVALRSLDGTKIWTRDEWFGEPVAFTKLLAHTDGTVIACGTIEFVGGGIGRYIIGVHGDGQKVWQQNDAHENLYLSCTALAATSPTTFVTFGPEYAKVGEGPDATYKVVLGEWRHRSFDDGALEGAVRSFKNSPMAAQSDSGGDRIAWAGPDDQGGIHVGLSDLLGNELFHRAVPGAPSALSGVALSPDRERVAIFGSTGSGSAKKPSVVVVDRWGFDSCKARGVCAGKSWKACDDGADCTADGCSATFGCTHAAVADNHCDPGVSCTEHGFCTTGTCKPADYGVIYISEPIGPPAQGSLLLGADGAPSAWGLVVQGGKNQNLIIGRATTLASGKLGSAGAFNTDQQIAPAWVARNGGGMHGVVGTLLGSTHKLTRVQCVVGLSHDQPVGVVDLDDPSCSTCDTPPGGVIAGKDGAFYTFTTSSRDGGTGLVARVPGNCSNSSQAEIGGKPKPVELLGAAPRADGGALFLGRLGSGDAARPTLWSYGADLKQGFLVSDALSIGGAFEAATERADGSLIAAGGMPDGATSRSLLVAYDAKGGPLWRKTPTVADGVRFASVLAMADGGLLLAGRADVGISVGLRLARVDGGGATVWQRTHLHEGVFSLIVSPGSLQQLSDGGMAMAVLAGNGYGGKLLSIVRSDASGYISCAAAGNCAAKAIAGCDDANPCTADWCDTQLGCQSAPVDGGPCGAGGACKAGKCVQP